MMKWTETASAGSGYDIQVQALQRLEPDEQAVFAELDTSGKIRAWAKALEEQLKPEELAEFNSYADYIGILFGFQDEKPIEEIAEG
jgi:hypothetical protein